MLEFCACLVQLTLGDGEFRLIQLDFKRSHAVQLDELTIDFEGRHRTVDFGLSSLSRRLDIRTVKDHEQVALLNKVALLDSDLLDNSTNASRKNALLQWNKLRPHGAVPHVPKETLIAGHRRLRYRRKSEEQADCQ